MSAALPPVDPPAAPEAPRGEAPGQQKVLTARGTPVPVAVWANGTTMQAQLDRCVGPVAIPMGDLPLLIAEHDYCGGKERIAARGTKDHVTVTGAGDVDGTYKIVSTKTVPKGSSTSALRGMGELVLQTCVGETLYLAGANRV